MKERRIGSISLGVTIILYGVLFFLHNILNVLEYEIIFRIWPIIFILLGVEILISSFIWKEREFKYDFAAVLMIGIVLVFAMALGCIDAAASHEVIRF